MAKEKEVPVNKTTTIRGFAPDLHKRLKVEAAKKGITFTAALIKAVEKYLGTNEH